MKSKNLKLKIIYLLLFLVTPSIFSVIPLINESKLYNPAVLSDEITVFEKAEATIVAKMKKVEELKKIKEISASYREALVDISAGYNKILSYQLGNVKKALNNLFEHFFTEKQPSLNIYKQNVIDANNTIKAANLQEKATDSLLEKTYSKIYTENEMKTVKGKIATWKKFNDEISQDAQRVITNVVLLDEERRQAKIEKKARADAQHALEIQKADERKRKEAEELKKKREAEEKKKQQEEQEKKVRAEADKKRLEQEALKKKQAEEAAAKKAALEQQLASNVLQKSAQQIYSLLKNKIPSKIPALNVAKNFEIWNKKISKGAVPLAYSLGSMSANGTAIKLPSAIGMKLVGSGAVASDTIDSNKITLVLIRDGVENPKYSFYGFIPGKTIYIYRTEDLAIEPQKPGFFSKKSEGGLPLDKNITASDMIKINLTGK